jgi:hypothetical protein
MELAFVVGHGIGLISGSPRLTHLIDCSAVLIRTGNGTPRDGCITELGLHRTIDETLGNNVAITIATRAPN